MFKLEVSDSASVSASSVVSGGDIDSLVCSWLFFSLCGAEEPGVTQSSPDQTPRRSGVKVAYSSQHAPGCPRTTPREVPMADPW